MPCFQVGLGESLSYKCGDEKVTFSREVSEEDILETAVDSFVAHSWTKILGDAGALREYWYWECSVCGAAGGVDLGGWRCFGDDPRLFVSNKTYHISLDCAVAQKQIEALKNLPPEYVPEFKIHMHDGWYSEEPEANLKDSSMVDHPDHYNQGGVECIDAIEAACEGLDGFEGFCTGNAMKYLWRWKHKNGVQDLEKSLWYINRLILSKKE